MEITGQVYEQTLENSKIPGAKLLVRFPSFSGDFPPRALGKINAFYRRTARRLLAHCACAKPPGAVCFECNGDYEVTYCENGILSVKRTAREVIDKVPLPEYLYAETWELSSGTPLSLKHFAHSLSGLSLIESFRPLYGFSSARRGTNAALLRRKFDKNRFYLTQDGICMFFEPGTLMPCDSGAQIFIANMPEKCG